MSGGDQGSQGSREAEGGPPVHTYTQALPWLGQRDTFSIINDLIQERNGLSESGLYFGPGGGRGETGSWDFGFITSRALCCRLCSRGEWRMSAGKTALGLRSYPWGPLYLSTVLVVLAGTVLVEPVASSGDSVLQTGPNSLGRDPAGGAGLCPPGEAGKTHRQGGELICAFYSGPQCGLTVMTIPQGWQHHPILKMRKLSPGEVWGHARASLYLQSPGSKVHLVLAVGCTA